MPLGVGAVLHGAVFVWGGTNLVAQSLALPGDGYVTVNSTLLVMAPAALVGTACLLPSALWMQRLARESGGKAPATLLVTATAAQAIATTMLVLTFVNSETFFLAAQTSQLAASGLMLATAFDAAARAPLGAGASRVSLAGWVGREQAGLALAGRFQEG